MRLLILGRFPNLEKLVATIRSRDFRLSGIAGTISAEGNLHKDNADTIIGNMDSRIFLGGSEPTTLKELNQALGKETIDTFNTFQHQRKQSFLWYELSKVRGKTLLLWMNFPVLDGSKCILAVAWCATIFVG